MVQQRAAAFQTFLDAIAADPKLRILPLVAAFLGAQARPSRGRPCALRPFARGPLRLMAPLTVARPLAAVPR